MVGQDETFKDSKLLDDIGERWLCTQRNFCFSNWIFVALGIDRFL